MKDETGVLDAQGTRFCHWLVNEAHSWAWEQDWEATELVLRREHVRVLLEKRPSGTTLETVNTAVGELKVKESSELPEGCAWLMHEDSLVVEISNMEVA